jgi:hypothetical protein
MATSLTFSMRRFASTIFVFIALCVACMSAGAMPCERDADASIAQEHAVVVADDVADGGDQPPLPSLEDNGGGVDDTFDVPAVHRVIVPRVATTRPGNVAPAPHAHHHSLDLRPPIA